MPMTPKEIQAECQAVRAEIGRKADVYCSVQVDDYRQCVLTFAVYPDGVTKGRAFVAEADDWQPLFQEARRLWGERQKEFHERIVIEMGLEIIRLTSLYGACTDAQLRGDKYSVEDVMRYGKEAIEKANSMAANGPFAIIEGDRANAA